MVHTDQEVAQMRVAFAQSLEASALYGVLLFVVGAVISAAANIVG
jgi:hypothetical protein